MKKGTKDMKYLEIKNNNVYYRNSNNESIPIDNITKEDLLYLINKALENDFEFDEYDSDKIGNQVHNIIYKSIESKIKDFISRKSEIIDDINSLYKDAINKYCK